MKLPFTDTGKPNKVKVCREISETQPWTVNFKVCLHVVFQKHSQDTALSRLSVSMGLFLKQHHGFMLQLVSGSIPGRALAESNRHVIEYHSNLAVLRAYGEGWGLACWE